MHEYQTQYVIKYFQLSRFTINKVIFCQEKEPLNFQFLPYHIHIFQSLSRPNIHC